ncbi:MAG: GNAT family N-acetyltransferase [Caulobacter sp.]|nr:GNAT family N-acetyltransferase [Caulobacter sp.]
MNNPTLQETLIERADSIEFDAFFNVYAESIQASERKSRDQIVALLQRCDYSIIAFSQYDEVIAFLIAYHSENSNVGLLEYMATKAEHRNRGIGIALFRAALNRMQGRNMLVEIDSDREESDDQGLRARRKNFYLRQGCRIIEGLDYKMPQVNAAKPPTMDLLIYDPSSEIVISEDLLRQWLQALYSEVYGCDRDDPAIEIMLEGWRRNNLC